MAEGTSITDKRRVTFQARLQKVQDLTHADSEKAPQITLWAPGEELSDTVKAAAYWCDSPVRMKITANGTAQTLNAYLKRVTFGQGKSVTLDFLVDLSGPFAVPVGSQVEVDLSK